MSGGRHRVLFVIKNLQQGGTETQLVRLLRHLDSDRFEHRLCTVAETGQTGERGRVSIHYRLGAQRRFGLGIVRGLAEAIDDYRPDLVHSFRDWVNLWVGLALARTRHQPAFLASVRGRPLSPIYLVIGGFLGRRVYRFTVNSRGIAGVLASFAGLPAEKIAIIDNLVDAASFPAVTPELRARARQRLGLPAEAFVWVTPARISYVKNQLGLVLALGLLRRSGRLDDHVRVVLAGRPRDRLPTAALPGLVSLLGLAPQVCIHPAVEDPLPLYHAADAMILPSWAEGMPNVSIEAQLCGLPVVVTAEANRDEIVADGETGLVVPRANPRAIADALARLTSSSPEALREMGRRGRARMEGRFGIAPRLGPLEGLYLEAIAAEAQRPR